MRRALALLVLLAACGDGGVGRRTFNVVLPGDEDPEVVNDFVRASVSAYDNLLVCSSADPDLAGVEVQSIAQATWNAPLDGGPPPSIRVPSGKPIAVVVEGFDEDDTLRFWGCDRDDEDGVLEVIVRRPCVALAGPIPCPFDGQCQVGFWACTDEDALICTEDCACTPGTLVDAAACTCCSDEGTVEPCGANCGLGCTGIKGVCIDCDVGTPLCVDDIAFCFPPDDDEDGFTPCAPAGKRDCDDDDPDVNPLAPETCDGQDQDCDGVSDDREEDDSGHGLCWQAFGSLAECQPRDALGIGCTCGDDICQRGDRLCCASGCLSDDELLEGGRCPQ